MTDCENVLESVVFGETLAIIILLIAVLFISLSMCSAKQDSAYWRGRNYEQPTQERSPNVFAPTVSH